MSGITLAQAQANLDALTDAVTGNIRSVRYSDGRTVEYSSLKELTEAINYWSRQVAMLQRTAAGYSRHGFAVADLRGAG